MIVYKSPNQHVLLDTSYVNNLDVRKRHCRSNYRILGFCLYVLECTRRQPFCSSQKIKSQNYRTRSYTKQSECSYNNLECSYNDVPCFCSREVVTSAWLFSQESPPLTGIINCYRNSHQRLHKYTHLKVIVVEKFAYSALMYATLRTSSSQPDSLSGT